MKSVRERFEEIWPVPAGVVWSEYGYYIAESEYDSRGIDAAFELDARLDTFTRCQEIMAIPEITKEHVQFALNCQMEDPSDDEEIGFCEGVSWCLSFIQQNIAKRNKK